MSFVRTRLTFQTPPPLYEIPNCWFLVDTSTCRIVADLEYLIQKRFGLHLDSERASISLFLDGYLLPSQEKIEIIKDGDDISVVETCKPVLLQNDASEEDERKRKRSSHQDQRKRSKGNNAPLCKTGDIKDVAKVKKEAAYKSLDSKTTSKGTLPFQKSNHTSVNQQKKGKSSISHQKQCKLAASKRCTNAHLVSNSSASYKHAASISEAKHSKNEKAKCNKDREDRFSGRHLNNKPCVSSSKKKSLMSTVSSNKGSSEKKNFDDRLKNGQLSSSASSSSSETSEQSGITSTKPNTNVISNNKSSFNSARYVDVFGAVHKDTAGVKGSKDQKRRSITTSLSSSDSSSSSTSEEEEIEINNLAIPSSSNSAHQVPGTKLVNSGKRDSSLSTSDSTVLEKNVNKAMLSLGSSTLEEIDGIVNEMSWSSSDEIEGKNKKTKGSLSPTSLSSSDDKPQGNSTKKQDVLVLLSLSGGTEDNSRRKATPLVLNNKDLSTTTTTQRKTDSSCKLLTTECKHPLQSNRNISVSTSRLQTIQTTLPEKSQGRTNGILSKRSHIRFESDEEEEEIATGNDTPGDISCGLQAAPMVAAKSPAKESSEAPLTLTVSTNQSFARRDLKSPQGSVTGYEKESQLVKSKDYSQFSALYGPPRVGDTIAYKILELSASYTPEISQYKEGKVIAFEPNSGTVMLELSADSLTKTRGDGNLTGKFELVYEENEENMEQVQLDTEVSVPWKSMISPLLLK